MSYRCNITEIKPLTLTFTPTLCPVWQSHCWQESNLWPCSCETAALTTPSRSAYSDTVVCCWIILISFTIYIVLKPEYNNFWTTKSSVMLLRHTVLVGVIYSIHLCLCLFISRAKLNNTYIEMCNGREQERDKTEKRGRSSLTNIWSEEISGQLIMPGPSQWEAFTRRQHNGLPQCNRN